MTKLKNTKKGMAKKALSISLVAAMLATSNVPVWAAEFTDGTDAVVEAPVVEEAVDTFSAEAEAPVEEVQEAPVVAAETTGTGYEVSNFAFNNIVKDNKVTWTNDGQTAQKAVATFTLKGEPKANETVKYIWKVNGLSVGDAQTVKSSKEGITITAEHTLSAKEAGKSLQLFVYTEDTQNNNNVTWSYTSDKVAVEAFDATEAMKANIKMKSDFAPVYDGEKHEATAANINFGNATADNYTVALSGDTTNVTDDGVTVTVTDKREGYKGSVALKYQILPMTLDGTAGKLISEHFVATLKTTNFVYTGNVIRVKASDVTVTDKDTKADLSNYLKADENGYVSLKATDVQGVGETKFKLNLIEGQPESGIKNYSIAKADQKVDPDGYRTVATDKATVTARDLSTVNVEVSAQTIPADGKLTLGSGAFKFSDAQGAELNLFNDLATVTIKDVTKAGTYEATLEPNDTTKNVTGTKKVTVTVVAASLEGSSFTGTGVTTDEEYTGEAVTKTAEQLGQLKDKKGNVIDKSLYEVVYKDNVNAGTAKVIVKGKGDFTGSEVEVTSFTIKPAKVTDQLITANKRVEYKDTTKATDYAKEFGLVVKAKNAKDKEFTLTEGTDYKVDYSFVNSNEVGQKVKATITITNKNFVKDATFTKETVIDHKAITSENIKLRQTTFTYTGKAIVPEFDVVIDGKVINPEFFTSTVVNNINAGTATLTVTGDGKNYSEEAVNVTFTINPAETNSLEGVIASKEYTGYSLTLAEEDFNLTLNKDRIKVYDNFTLTYGTNVEIGEGTVTLTPKNGNFTGSKTFTFQITGDMLKGSGKFTFYDENGIEVKNPSFTYDGTAHEYAKSVFTYTNDDVAADKLVEGVDYEIKYVDNIYGKDVDYKEVKGQHVAVLAIAKGKYGSNFTNDYGLEKGVYTDAAGNKIANVIAVKYIKLNQLTISKSNVAVSNGTYAAGLPVKPNVDIVVNGVVLKEGQDYELDLTANKDLTNVTASKSLTGVIKGKNGYTGSVDINWGIDKFNLANADVSVDGDKVVVKCGRVDVEASEYTVDRKDNTVTVTAAKDSKNYTGSKTIDVKTESEKPAAPMITDVQVKGNNATVILSGDSEGAVGYDYVISKDRNCINNKKYAKVNKNILTTKTTFTYTGQGTYYAYCHAWKKVDGKKVFSDWSNAYPFVVTSITPEQPAITSVKVSKNTVKVTYTKSANATGYDLVLGKSMKKVNGEMRPVDYGKLVKKVYNGNTVTATFTKVPKGTYYVGLHAYNRTSEDGKKVFSPWSNARKVVVK